MSRKGRKDPNQEQRKDWPAPDERGAAPPTPGPGQPPVDRERPDVDQDEDEESLYDESMLRPPKDEL